MGFVYSRGTLLLCVKLKSRKREKANKLLWTSQELEIGTISGETQVMENIRYFKKTQKENPQKTGARIEKKGLHLVRVTEKCP